MPSLADIVVKKHDNATDITWAKQQPGSSLQVPAIWQSTLGVAYAHRPELRFWLMRRGGQIKDVSITGQYPTLSTNSTTGITSVIGRQRFKGVWTLDHSMPQTDINEFAAQISNLLASSLIRDGIRTGVGYS